MPLSMALPNLFVVGAPKCGTSSLHRYLDQHPRITMARLKEPKFFLTDGTRPAFTGPGDERACRAYVVERAAYEAMFSAPAPGSYAGESSPYYLWDPAAAPRIRAAVPEARLVAALREPTARAYSNWSDLREQGREKLDFAAALAAEGERQARGWEPFWAYRSLGLYGEQLARLFTVFAPHRVKVILAEDLAEDPDRVLGEVFAFLGLDPLDGPLEEERRNQTMYGAVDRRSRAVQSLFDRGQRLRPVVPKPLRRLGRAAVQRRLRSQATAGGQGVGRRRRFDHLFADDRRLLGELGIDVTRWGGPEGL